MAEHDSMNDRSWRDRFPDARCVIRGEGEAIFLAEAEGAWWVIWDSSTIAGLLPDEDLGDPVRIQHFDTWDAARRCVLRATAPRTASIAAITLEEAAPRIARELEIRAAGRSLVRINERDHLRPWAIEVVGATRPRVVAPLATRGEAPHGLGEKWPRLGTIDLALGDDSTLPAFIELKCGSDRDALCACAWDLIKLAFCAAEGVSSAGFILAATTAANWDKPVRGAELFERHDWSADELRSRFADWWEYWEKDGATSVYPTGYHPPPLVPAEVSTRPLGPPCSFSVGGAEWRIRVGEVSIRGSETFAWQRFRTSV